MKIYVASSWRNKYQPEVVAQLRAAGHEVYDFRNPPHRDTGFSWASIDPNWENWTQEEYEQALEHPLAISGFDSDLDGMSWANACVMVTPCGRSAHLEAGWFTGHSITVAYMPETQEPDLMYKLFDCITSKWQDVIDFLAGAQSAHDESN